MNNNRKTSGKPADLEVVVEKQALFSGPLPPPQALKGYGEIDSQYPERIFKMAEAYSAAEVKGKNTESLAVILGMVLSFLVSLAGLSGCLFLALKGLTAESITAAVAGFSPILVNALSNITGRQK